MQKKITKKQKTQQKHLQRSIIAKPEIKEFEPLTTSQSIAFDSFDDGKHLVLHGLAGTGKTFISLYLALDEILADDSVFKKILIVRSIVPSREIGYLPGSIKEKISVYENPYIGICNKLFNIPNAYNTLKNSNYIEFIPTSFIRGDQFDDVIVIVDEIQNMTDMELHTVLTRMGENCRFIMCGDYRQNDLADKRGEQSGILQTLKILDLIPSVKKVEFGVQDIVRSGFVKDYIIARNKLGLV